jgi:prolyl oligopeptidase
MRYPFTKKRRVTETIHGVMLQEDYRWLEKKNDPEVTKWDEAQNKFTRSYLDKLPQRQELVELYKKHENYDMKFSIQRLRKSPRVFQYRRFKDKEKSIVFTAENYRSEMVELINPNNWPEDENLSDFNVSEDGKLLCFSKTKGGNESWVLYIMEVESGKILSDKLLGWRQLFLSWLPDNSGFYYCSYPGKEDCWRTVYLHILGTDSSKDVKVYWDDDEKYRSCVLFCTYDYKYTIYIKTPGHFRKQSMWIKKSGSDALRTITDTYDARYYIAYHNDKIYLLTDKDASNKRIFVADADNPEINNWQELIPESKYSIEVFEIIQGKIFVTYVANIQTKIHIFDLNGNFLREIKLPIPGTTSVYGEPDGVEIWIGFSSFTYPYTLFTYNFEEDKLVVYSKPSTIMKVDEICTKQVWFTSKDGTSIPMFLIYNKNMIKNGKNPTQLYGYGGFDISWMPYYDFTRAIWVKCGGIMAIANLRGGGEFGEKWHQEGMKENKQNVFDDFIAAVEYLISENYTCSEKLAVSGGSNGGLLIGAVINQRPELMKAALCMVPVLDMIHRHKTNTNPIGDVEYGCAEVADEFEYLLKYSPIHNVKENTKFPATLVATGINDARVDPYHARKFAALLQEKNVSPNPIYLLLNYSSGHHGGTTKSIQHAQRADYNAFLMDQLDMKVIKS